MLIHGYKIDLSFSLDKVRTAITNGGTALSEDCVSAFAKAGANVVVASATGFDSWYRK